MMGISDLLDSQKYKSGWCFGVDIEYLQASLIMLGAVTRIPFTAGNDIIIESPDGAILMWIDKDPGFHYDRVVKFLQEVGYEFS